MSPLRPRGRSARPPGWRGWVAAAALAFVAVGFPIWLVGTGESRAEQLAARFAAAWERGDYRAMHGLLAPQARARVSRGELTRAYERARATATATRVVAGEGEEGERSVRVPVAVRTRIFGVVSGDVFLPVEEDGVAWEQHLVFPGLPRAARLRRVTSAPARASLLARDGTTLTKGPAGAREALPQAAAVTGSLGPPRLRAERRELHARGFPPDEPIGLSGLERILQWELAGTPGGVLFAGKARLASSAPRAARTVTSTIDLEVQRAADTALGERFGGIAALDARTGEVRALAGIAFSGPQPPGSTFKVVTATAALEARLVTPATRFPVRQAAVIDGVRVENSEAESCGGSFRQSFAQSCNSVFAPLGVKLGAERLVETAERYGFNEPVSLPGARSSTLPKAGAIRSELELGATAIGQGSVLATPLALASVAQTVASGGLRHRPRLVAGASRPPPVRVTSPGVAATLEELMVAAVESGTGTRAALGRGEVAGKTGTAELETTQRQQPESGELGDEGSDTDAWFAAYAPAQRPGLAVAVLLVRQGHGGDTAAPAAREVLRAAVR